MMFPRWAPRQETAPRWPCDLPGLVREKDSHPQVSVTAVNDGEKGVHRLQPPILRLKAHGAGRGGGRGDTPCRAADDVTRVASS